MKCYFLSFFILFCFSLKAQKTKIEGKEESNKGHTLEINSKINTREILIYCYYSDKKYHKSFTDDEKGQRECINIIIDFKVGNNCEDLKLTYKFVEQ